MRNAISTVLVAFVLTLCEKAATAGTPYNIEWAQQFGSSTSDSGQATSVDPAGNVFVAGTTLGNLGGQTNQGSFDAYVSKFDSSGTMLWARFIGTSADEMRPRVVVDAAGNSYVSGITNGDLAGSAGGDDGFVRKYDPSGSISWTRQFGTTGEDEPHDIALDNAGNIYVTGYTFGNLDGQTNSGNNDAFIRKLDSNGTLIWSRILGTNGFESSNSLSLDSAGNVYITGSTGGALAGQPYSGGTSDMFLSRFDSSGNFQWARLLGSAGSEVGRSVQTDAAGMIYISGNASQSLDGQTYHGGSTDAFLTKYDTTGARLWTRLHGTSSVDFGGDIILNGASGDILMTGQTRGSLGGPHQGLYDAYLTEWTASGVMDWTQQFGTNDDDDGNALARGPLGHIYWAGETAADLFGDLDGGSDAFLVRFTPEPACAALLLIAWAAIPNRRRVTRRRKRS